MLQTNARRSAEATTHGMLRDGRLRSGMACLLPWRGLPGSAARQLCGSAVQIYLIRQIFSDHNALLFYVGRRTITRVDFEQIVMGHVVVAVYSYGPCSYGLYSYGHFERR